MLNLTWHEDRADAETVYLGIPIVKPMVHLSWAKRQEPLSLTSAGQLSCLSFSVFTADVPRPYP